MVLQINTVVSMVSDYCTCCVSQPRTTDKLFDNNNKIGFTPHWVSRHEVWICALCVSRHCDFAGRRILASTELSRICLQLRAVLASTDSFISQISTRKRNFLQENAENGTFFCKEHKRTERTFCSFAKNVKELENVLFFCKIMQKNAERCVLFFNMYI